MSANASPASTNSGALGKAEHPSPSPERRAAATQSRWKKVSQCTMPSTAAEAEKDEMEDGMVEQMLGGLLKTLDVSGYRRIRRRDFIKALRDKGLSRGDPRLTLMFEALDELDVTDLQISELASIARLGGKIVMDALASKVIIPDFAVFCEQIKQIYDEVLPNTEGSVADYIPQLAQVDPEKFAVAITTIDGQRFSIGDADELFCLQSSSKPVTYSIALEEHGMEKVHTHVGREPSGRTFNEMALKEVALKDRKVEGRVAIPHNPCINAGAIMCTSLVKPAAPLSERLSHYLHVWSELCGRQVSFDPTVMVSERGTADRNNALAYMMKESGAFEEGININETLELYFSTCAVTLTCEMQATAAATLANGGENPLTQRRIFEDDTCRMAMSLMLSCGMYDFSGEWAFSVGLPAKSGVSGTLMIVVPNVCGICVWSPRLDRVGNSVRGVDFAQRLVQRFAFHHLDSQTRSKKVNPVNQNLGGHNDISVLFDLLTAAAAGDLPTVQALTARGASVNGADYDQRTALHLAASDGRDEVVTFLLAQGANPHAIDRWGNKPVNDALTGKYSGIVTQLEEAEATYVSRRDSRRSWSVSPSRESASVSPSRQPSADLTFPGSSE